MSPNAQPAPAARPSTGPRATPCRLLLPVNADDASRHALAYALRRHADGDAVEVVLLHVAEPVTQWQVLRFRTPAEVDAFQAARAQAFLDAASQPLVQAGISCRGFFRQGPVVASILDLADELACDEIVLPLPESGWLRLLGRDTVRVIRQRQRGVPVITVDREGRPGREAGD